LTDKGCIDTIQAHDLNGLHDPCIDSGRDLVILTFEPLPKNFELIKRTAAINQWKKVNWVGFQAAVASKTGQANFYTSNLEGDEQASQDQDAAYNAAFTPASGPTILNVAVVSVDDMMNGVVNSVIAPSLTLGNPDVIPRYLANKSQFGIFLLKIDTEGYDMDVIDGAKETLKSQKALFVSFEYNSKWFTAKRSRTLRQVTLLLSDYGYDCFWITHVKLIPISGNWWDDSFEIRDWSNVFCGLKDSETLKWLVTSYNTNPLV
jgi:FkbM family methyltransferase